MGKTSPVVVPITADLNPFRNAMRGLRSSFTGGGGAGTGGFGSGGNNAGGVGYGGGGGGSGIVGTAIGAGLGARLGTTKGVAGKAPTFVERMKEHFEVNERRQVMASAQRNVARAERAKNAALLRYGGSSQQYTFADMDLDEAMREQSAYRKYYQPHRRA